MVNVYSYNTTEDIAEALGKYVLRHQEAAIRSGAAFKVAVSGGSLCKVLRKALVENPEVAKKVEWKQWEVYFSDERIVPLDHADSNYALFKKEVLDHIQESPKVVTIDPKLITGKDGQAEGADTDKDDEIAEKYEDALPEEMDLVLLGCGPDGHTCSLFPEHEALKERDLNIVAVEDSPKEPPRRISFTLKYLESAGAIAFVAEGSSKVKAVAEIFDNPRSGLPCQLVNNLDADVSWFVNADVLEEAQVHTSKY
ncbi:6-phosphogluconolactonase 3 [Diutina catenulata]